jgi:hypothetical protein
VGTDMPPFSIVGSAFQTRAPLNYEIVSVYNIWIRVMDPHGARISWPFTITVADANDVPSAVHLSDLVVPENVAGVIVGLLSTVDDDVAQTHTYELLDPLKTDSGVFHINGSYLMLSTVVDFERTSTLTVRIRSTDNGTPFTRALIADFQIEVIDINEMPTSVEIATAEIGQFAKEVTMTENRP